MKSPIKQLAMLGAILLLPVVPPAAFGQVTMTDIGSTTPTPGSNDVAQTNSTYTSGYDGPDNLNYYIDNGANNNAWPGQTFTTGSNPNGYTLNSVSIYAAADGGGGYNNSQLFHLYIFSVSGGNAKVIGNYTATASFSVGHWVLWTNLAMTVTPNTTYAYGFGRDSSGQGWVGLGNDSSNPYSGGELAMLPVAGPGTAGAPIIFGASHAYDATFIVGLTPSTNTQPPQIAVQPASLTVYTNSPATFSVQLDPNNVIPSYQWWKGTSPLDGETNASLTIPSAQSGDVGDYTVVITNVYGAVTSSVATLAEVPGNPNVMSVQLYSDHWGPIGVQPLLPDDMMGAFPTANWDFRTVRFLSSGYQTNVFNGLKDGNGYISPVTLTVLGVNDAWRYNDPPPDSAPITKLLNTFLKTTNPGGGNTLGDGLMQFVYSNLDDTKTYDIYVYVGGASDAHPNVDAGNGTTVYSGPEFGSVDQSSSLVGCYNTDPNGTRNQANFVQLKNVTPTAGVITVSVQYDPALDTSAGSDLGVSGLQIVESSLDAVAPTIQTQPANATVYTNVPTTFTVSMLGVPTPNIQWYKIVGGVTNLISGATGATAHP